MDSSDMSQNNGLNSMPPVAPNPTQPNPNQAAGSVFAQAPIQQQTQPQNESPVAPAAQAQGGFNAKKLIVVVIVLVVLCLGGSAIAIMLSKRGGSGEAPTTRKENEYVSGVITYNKNIKIDDMIKVNYPSGFKNVSDQDYIAKYVRKGTPDFFNVCESNIYVVDGFYDAKKYAENVAKDYEGEIVRELEELDLNSLKWYGFVSGTKELPKYHYFASIKDRVYRFDFDILTESSQCKDEFKKILYSIEEK